jgi:hypothetical protein
MLSIKFQVECERYFIIKFKLNIISGQDIFSWSHDFCSFCGENDSGYARRLDIPCNFMIYEVVSWIA